jgi:phosphate transport system permease protein
MEGEQPMSTVHGMPQPPGAGAAGQPEQSPPPGEPPAQYGPAASLAQHEALVARQAGPAPAAAETRVKIRRVTPEGAATLAGSSAGALGLTWMLYERVLPFSGALGFWLCWYLAFVLLYAAMAGMQWSRLVVRDRVMSVALATGGLFACAVVIDQFGYTLGEGLHAVSHLNFFTATMAYAGPLSPLSVGGILHALVGSLEQIGLATLFSVPLGVTTAVFLSEVGGRWERPVRTIVNAMTALPSIVAGLFILAFAILTLGLQESGLAASLAVAVVMLPTVSRASEVVIRVVPGTLREAAYALGASQWRTVWSVILPTARSGLATAVTLAMARGIGETAPILLTAGFTKEMNANPLTGWQATLPTYIFNGVEIDGQIPNYVVRAFGAGLTLMLVVLILFTIARLLGGAAPGELSRRQRRMVRREMAGG